MSKLQTLRKEDVRLVLDGFTGAMFDRWLAKINEVERDKRLAVQNEQVVFDLLSLDHPRTASQLGKIVKTAFRVKNVFERLAERGVVEKCGSGWVRTRGKARPVEYENQRVNPELRTFMLAPMKEVAVFLADVRSKIAHPQPIMRKLYSAKVKHARGAFPAAKLKQIEKSVNKDLVDITRVTIANGILGDAITQVEQLTISTEALAEQLFMVRDNLRVSVGLPAKDRERLHQSNAGRLPRIKT